MQGNVAILKTRRGPKGLTRAETARQIRVFNDPSRVRTKTFPRQEFQRAHRDLERGFQSLVVPEASAEARTADYDDPAGPLIRAS